MLITPWVLFALLWPLSEIWKNSQMPAELWTEIDLYASSQSSPLALSDVLIHPNLHAPTAELD